MMLVRYDSRVDKLQKVKSLFSLFKLVELLLKDYVSSVEKDLIPATLIKIVTLSTLDGQPYYGNSEIDYCGDRLRLTLRKCVMV